MPMSRMAVQPADVRAVWNRPIGRNRSSGWCRKACSGTQHVRGSNHCLLGVYEDRVPGRVILVSTLDNLVKGSSGQALQNMNVMFGLPRRRVLDSSRCSHKLPG